MKALQDRAERIQALKLDKNTLLASFLGAVPDTLDELTSEERRHLYEMLKLRLVASVDGILRWKGRFAATLVFITSIVGPFVPELVPVAERL